MAETSRLQEITRRTKVAMEDQGYTFLDQSEPYPCQPPKQLESRIYMVFR